MGAENVPVNSVSGAEPAGIDYDPFGPAVMA